MTSLATPLHITYHQLRMALDNGPYYTTSSQVVDELEGQDLHNGQPSIYPDLGQPTVSESHMYALADDALQAHKDTAGHLVGLIQAATAAAGQDDGSRRHISSSPSRFRHTTRKAQGLNHDLRHLSAEEHEELHLPRGYETMPHPRNSRKRKRVSDDGAEIGSDPRACSNVQQSVPGATSSVFPSANALFRRPSISNKKYTRPPMHKLYTSLELSADNFLQLQCAAKHYMLDESHPERRDTVGQRGKGDSELVKLRLWNCVKEFLDREGNGDRFFGPHVPGEEGQARTMFWPLHKNNLISAITPLLRRMVTNERQRQYAVQIRKPDTANEIGSDEKPKQHSLPPSQIDQQDDRPPEGTRRVDVGPHDVSNNMSANDVTNQQAMVVSTNTSGAHDDLGDALQSDFPFVASESGSLEVNMTRYLGLHVSVLTEGKRLLPRFDIPAANCSNLNSMLQKIVDQYHDSSLVLAKVKVLLPNGLVEVRDDSEWGAALGMAESLDWMDGELKVIAEL